MDPRGDRRYRVAGLGYGALGALILIVTVASPRLLEPERRGDLAHLLVALPFFVFFALAIAFFDRWVAAGLGLVAGRRLGPERRSRIGRWCREKLVMVLTLSAFGRTAVFAANALGYRPRLRSGLAFERIEPDPRTWLSALLMAVIAALLFRASWLPWWHRFFGSGAATGMEERSSGSEAAQ